MNLIYSGQQRFLIIGCALVAGNRLTCKAVADEGKATEVPLKAEDDLEGVPQEQGHDDPEAHYGGYQGQGDEQLDHHQPP